MIVTDEVSLATIQRHEEATASNVRLGHYDMDRHCPTSEFICYRVQLERQDEDRLFLLGLTEFSTQTRGNSCRVRDVLLSASAIVRVASFLSSEIDLRSHSGLELVLVAADLDGAPLVAIDGNHRAIAQFLSHGTADGVPAFVCVHSAIGKWKFVPRLARTDMKRHDPVAPSTPPRQLP